MPFNYKIRNKPGRSVLLPLYIEWLGSRSLRAIAGQNGMAHQSLHSWLKEEFGMDATDPVALSLQRSMLEDYPGNPLVQEWVKDHLATRSEKQHRSEHSLQELTRFQTARDDEILEFMVEPMSYSAGQDDRLRLPLFIWFSARLCDLLALAALG